MGWPDWTYELRRSASCAGRIGVAEVLMTAHLSDEQVGRPFCGAQLDKAVTGRATQALSANLW